MYKHICRPKYLPNRNHLNVTHVYAILQLTALLANNKLMEWEEGRRGGGSLQPPQLQLINRPNALTSVAFINYATMNKSKPKVKLFFDSHQLTCHAHSDSVAAISSQYDGGHTILWTIPLGPDLQPDSQRKLAQKVKNFCSLIRWPKSGQKLGNLSRARRRQLCELAICNLCSINFYLPIY